MTAAEIIEIVDRAEPNMIDAGKKLKWLSDLDHKTFDAIAKVCKEGEWEEYSAENIDRVLFIPDPYALDVYEPYLRSRIAADNMEAVRHNQLTVLFNSAYQEFLDWHNRNRVARQSGNRFRF